MRKDKLEAFSLRKTGKSYREIEKALGVSRGTLSFWFKNFDWASDISKVNHTFNYSPEKMCKMREARRRQLDALYEDARQEAIKEYLERKHSPLFVAALMVYAGEGDKTESGLVRIVNTDPRILLVFKHFLEKYYPDIFPKLRVSILLYPDLETAICLDWWAKSLGVDTSQFHKPVRIVGRHKTRRLQYGVASIIISNKVLKTKILKLIDLVLKDL